MHHPRRNSDNRRIFLVMTLLAVGLSLAAAPPAQALRICSYNLLNYDNAYSTRDGFFQTVISNISNIDVLAVQEMQDLTAYNRFKTNVLDVIEPGQWSAATFYNDASANFNQALYYRTSAVTVQASGVLDNYPREIAWYRVRAVGYTTSDAEITLYVHHFKASSGSSNEAIRLVEAQLLRSTMNAMAAGTNMIVLGDFNMYDSFESAYIQLTGSQADNDGRMFDPINRPGNWHDTSAFADIHTQSTRTTNLGDGGATGGMDDRFDFILSSSSLLDGSGLDLLTATYTAHGQDGNHFNSNINDAPTIPEGSTVADALQGASDHLPVWVDAQVPALGTADASLGFGTVILGAVADQTLNVSNTATAPADDLDYTLVAPVGFTVPGGPFSDAAGGGGNGHTVTMITVSSGVKGGTLVTNSNDPETPARNTTLSGTVLDHAAPSLSGLGSVPADTLDWGAASEGAFVDQNQDVYNLGYGSLQALLDVYNANITGGDGRFSFVGGFSAAEVGGTPATFTLHFNDTGATGPGDSTFTATLVFENRDKVGIPGATNLADLTVTLRATVEASQVAVGDPTPRVSTLLAVNRPNPFFGATRIDFSLAEEGPVEISVYDVRGRRVVQLASGRRPAGAHEIRWDGRDSRGAVTPPGVYFYVLRTGDQRLTRRMTKLD